MRLESTLQECICYTKWDVHAQTQTQFSLLACGQHCCCFIPPNLPLSPALRGRGEEETRTSGHSETVLVVGGDEASCWRGGSGLGWGNKPAPWRLMLALEASAGCFLPGWGDFLHLGGRKKGSLLWCDWKMEKLEGMLTVFGGKSWQYLSSLTFFR